MKRIIEFFIKDNNNLEKNIELYEQKKKTKQQKSKIYGQKLIKRTNSKKKSTRLHN